jgi:hypothetical protein
MSTDSRRLLFSTAEGYLEEWFEQHYKELGFQYIQHKPQRGTKAQFGDYFGIFKGHFVNIEIETHSGGFFSHKKYVRDQIQVIVCCYDCHFFPNKTWTNQEMEERKHKTIIECDHLIFPHLSTSQREFLNDTDLGKSSPCCSLDEITLIIKELEEERKSNSLKPIAQMK